MSVQAPTLPPQKREEQQVAPEARRSGSDGSRWASSALISVGLHGLIVLLGLWTVTDDLLKQISEGEVLAMGAPPEEQIIELDLIEEEVPEPEPLAEPPEFVVPEEVKKEEAKPKPPEPKPEPRAPRASVPETRPQREMAFAPSGALAGNRNFPKPPYPFEAKKRRIQGTVGLTITVVNGEITSVTVARSSGYGILDSTAQSWVRQRWKFPEGLTRQLAQDIQFELASP